MTSASSHHLQSQINVTPLIDVLLVLLITFMVITPLMPKGLDAQIPTPAPPMTPEPARPPVVLQVAADGTLRLNQRLVARAELRAALKAAFLNQAHPALFFDAPKDAEYRVVLSVMDEVHGFDPGIQVAFLH